MKARTITWILAVMLYGCGGGSNNSMSPPTSSMPPPSATPTPAPAETFTVSAVESAATVGAETTDPMAIDSTASVTPADDETSDAQTVNVQ